MRRSRSTFWNTPPVSPTSRTGPATRPTASATASATATWNAYASAPGVDAGAQPVDEGAQHGPGVEHAVGVSANRTTPQPPTGAGRLDACGLGAAYSRAIAASAS